MASWMLVLIRVLKYAVAFTAVAGVGFLIHSLDTFRYGVQPFAWSMRSMLAEDYEDCIYSPSKVLCLNSPGYLMSPRESSDNYPYASSYRNGTKSNSSVRSLIVDFLRMVKALGVEAVLIEPSILFCMLAPEQKQLLLKRHVPMKSLMGSSNIVTFAVFKSSAVKLDDPDTMKLIETQHAFRQWRVKRRGPPWSSNGKLESDTTHHFFTRRQMMVHAVVLYPRNTYFWHAALDQLPSGIKNMASKNDLLFSNAESSYDKFSSELLEMRDSESFGIPIPQNPAYFLLQIPVSKFLECRVERKPPQDLNKKEQIWYLRLQLAFEASVEHLKSRLSPLLMNFWLFGGTLLGWYRQCGIIPYTTDVDFAAWAVNVEDQDYITQKLKHIDYMPLISRMGLVEEALEFRFHHRGASIDLFFIYQYANDTLWYALHESLLSYSRYIYPKFDLCSADLQGHRVLVPCNTEEIILADYGSNWTLPVSNWNYLTSPSNRGPVMFWPEDKIGHVYESFR